MSLVDGPGNEGKSGGSCRNEVSNVLKSNMFVLLTMLLTTSEVVSQGLHNLVAIGYFWQLLFIPCRTLQQHHDLVR